MQQNRLKDEKSPYLLQHANNPVDWYPWSDEAFAEARREDKPVFLSIGYSTCHWCHVMERESFGDEKTACLLNEAFVCVKVDREERPDIDNIYMKVCQMMTHSGGWPLTIIMTPDKKPFFAATYIPRITKYGRIGLLELIPRIRELWGTKKQELTQEAVAITHSLQRQNAQAQGKTLSEETLDNAYDYFARNYDHDNGGFGIAPKFPTPHNLYFLLRYHKRKKNSAALQMAEKTLTQMRRGGIYDHIGFGFHRYSTDAQWIVPHFEKMLYDQALLAIASIEACQLTQKKEYEKTAREIFAYVLADMTDVQGGFYCAEDADSEGVEGKFYLWSQEEIRRVLTKDEADLFSSIYMHSEDMKMPGMQEMPERYFIPRLDHFVADIQQNMAQRLDDIRGKLFSAREKRIHPHKDDKILADWNGMMIAALARAAQAFGENSYLDAASRAMDFILNRMTDNEGRLLHRWRDGAALITAMLDDYAFVVWGLLELYEAGWQTKYLDMALKLNQQMLDHYWDEKDGGLFFTPDDGEELLVRLKGAHDGAIPSGNSVAMLNLLRLARMTGNTEWENKATGIASAFSAEVAQFPAAYTQFLVALDFALGPSYEVVIVGDPGKEDTEEMIKVLRENFMPNKIVLLRPAKDDALEILKIAPFLRSFSATGSKAKAYVCTNYSCQSPAETTKDLITLLSG